MILIGHRGCSYPGYNQNTIRSFEKVAAEGVAAIEFDVQLSKDQELVIVHNLDLEQVSNGTGKVSSTSSAALRKLWAGDPARGKDRIPFLREAFDFFAALPPDIRPKIHLELKGNGTGLPAGQLIERYIGSKRLELHDFLISSFNWKELENIRTLHPSIAIALLDGAIRRTRLLDKTGPTAEIHFEKIFAYGGEQYMLPRFTTMEENLALLDAETMNQELRIVIAEEIEICLSGGYYNDSLLAAVSEMKASSLNLWFKTVTAEFIDKAHKNGIAVLVYTVNNGDELLRMANMGVDGIFTDFYRESAVHLSSYMNR